MGSLQDFPYSFANHHQSPRCSSGSSPCSRRLLLPLRVTSPNATAVDDEEKHGILKKGRQAEIPRKEGEIMHLVHNWDNRSIVPAKTINSMKQSQSHMISKEMRPIMEVLKKEQHFKTVKGQFKHYFETAIAEPVRCWEEHGTQLESLMARVSGGMSPKEFKKTINDSTIGTLNKYLMILRTYLEEETDPKLR